MADLKITVFISYSSRNSELRDEVVDKLSTLSWINLRFDRRDIEGGAIVHESISKMLNDAEVTLALITSDWLESDETRDELIRSNERRKYLLCFTNQNLLKQNDEQHKLPWFITDRQLIKFNENNKRQPLDELVAHLVKIRHNIKIEKQNIYKRIRHIGDIVQKSEQPFYRLNLAYQEIGNTLSEIKKILSEGEYILEIGNIKSYMARAISIFETAATVRAVSIIGVSDFWQEAQYRDLVAKYLEAHTKNKNHVTRLFVFESPIQVNDFKNILEANRRSYGKLGGIFLCTKSTYEKFIRDTFRGKLSTFADVFDNDFGVLSYAIDDIDYEFIEAKLDAHSLRFKPFDVENVSDIALKDFVETFDDMLENTIEGEFVENYNVLRWSSNFLEDKAKFAQGLSKMFAGDEDLSSVIHLIFFKNCKSENMDNALFDLRRKFLKIKDDLSLKNIQLFTCLKGVYGYDGRFWAELLRDKDIDYVILAEFKDEKSLSHYYSHREHSLEREKIYRLLNPDVSQYYAEINKLNRLKETDKVEITNLFNKIEVAMQAHLFRIDIRVANIINLIVEQEGIPFGRLRH